MVLHQKPESPASPVDAASPQSSKANRYVAGSFWSSLTSEVKALAEAFEEDGPPSEEEVTSPETTPPSAPYALDPTQSGATGYELLFCLELEDRSNGHQD